MGLGIGGQPDTLAWAVDARAGGQIKYQANGVSNQHIPWVSKWIDVSPYAGVSISLFAFIHNWNKSWCNASSHYAKIRADELYYSRTIGGDPL